jgi:hypothetical protein
MKALMPMKALMEVPVPATRYRWVYFRATKIGALTCEMARRTDMTVADRQYGVASGPAQSADR